MAMVAADHVDAYVAALPEGARRVAAGEWGVSLDPAVAGGRPLHVGLRLAGGILTAKALALSEPGGVDPWALLWWNRDTRYVRFGCSRGGEIWVHGDLPAEAVDERAVDRLLGLVVEAAVTLRSAAAPA